MDEQEEHIEDIEFTERDEVDSRWEGLRLRAISAVAMAGIAITVLWFGGWWFSLFTIIVGLLALREWDVLTAADRIRWKLGGLFYIAIPCASLIWLRGVHMDNVNNAGTKLVLFILFIVWATDIGAYMTGKQIGGPKLAPSISPKKTWAGLGGGVASAAIIAGLSASFSPYPASFIACVLLGIIMALLAQIGDLFKSWVKRRIGVKDSGTLIPGHGGVIDRIDGLMLTVPLFAWLVYLSGKVL